MKEKVDKLYFIKIVYSVFRKVSLRLEKPQIRRKYLHNLSDKELVSEI